MNRTPQDEPGRSHTRNGPAPCPFNLSLARCCSTGAGRQESGGGGVQCHGGDSTGRKRLGWAVVLGWFDGQRRCRGSESAPAKQEDTGELSRMGWPTWTVRGEPGAAVTYLYMAPSEPRGGCRMVHYMARLVDWLVRIASIRKLVRGRLQAGEQQVAVAVHDVDLADRAQEHDAPQASVDPVGRPPGLHRAGREVFDEEGLHDHLLAEDLLEHGPDLIELALKGVIKQIRHAVVCRYQASGCPPATTASPGMLPSARGRAGRRVGIPTPPRTLATSCCPRLPLRSSSVRRTLSATHRP